MKNRVSWWDISKYRNQLFSIAIITIYIHHFFENSKFHIATGIWNKVLGADGVEIFLFLSGMGLCFSLNRKYDLRQFYIKRFKRILPTYLIVGVITWGLIDFVFFNKPNSFIEDLFFITFITEGNRLYWFILFILVMYLVYPYIYGRLRWENEHREWNFIFFLLISVAINMFVSMFDPGLYNNIGIAINRMTVFLVGSYYGEKIFHKCSVKKFDLGIVILGAILKAVIIFTNHFKLLFLPQYLVDTFYTFTLLFIVIYVLKFLDKLISTKWLARFGKYSLELYLLNVSLRRIFDYVGFSTSILLNYVVLTIIAIVLSILLHNVVEWGMNRLS